MKEEAAAKQETDSKEPFKKEKFFTSDKKFYKTFFRILIMVALQNLVAYSVNMADNIMLGAYNQVSLSGAATVNQVFFLVQQFSITLGDSLVILSSQYWGQKRTGEIATLTGIALKTGLTVGLVIMILCMAIPEQILSIFTGDPEIIREGVRYLQLIQITFPIFIVTNVLVAALRSVQVVRISFIISVVSLITDVVINYILIFGRFGAPELGVVGASIGTLTARCMELLVVVLYLVLIDHRLELGKHHFLRGDRGLAGDFRKVSVPVIISGMLWAVSVPMQTAVLGHLPGGVSSDAIAANSVSTTFYQYLKVIVVAVSSASSVVIGTTIGEGDIKKVRAEARTMSVIDVCIGIVLGLLLFLLRGTLLSNYSLNDRAMNYANQMIMILSVVMVGMSYQMPVSTGIIRGSGDTKFSLIMNTVSTWGIVMPLTFISAFLLKWPVPAVVLVIQSDQIFKGLPTFLRFRSYKWIRKLTK